MAQESDTTEINIPRNPRFGEYNRPFLELNTEFGAASRQWSTNQMVDFFYGDFIDENQKAAMMDKSPNGLALAAVQNWEIRFAYSGHFKTRMLPLPARSIYMYNRYYTNLTMPSDLLGLFLYGNKGTAGQAQNIGDFSYQSWFYSGIGHQMTFMADTFPVSLGISLVAIHNLTKYQVESGSLYTQPDGSAIEFNGQYDFGETTSPNSYSISGWGLAVNLETAEEMGKHKIRLGVYDFGLAYMSNWERIQRDSSFVFEGLDVGSVFTLEEEGFNSLVDSLQAGVVGQSQMGSWQALPFNLKAYYSYQFLDRHFAFMEMQYLHLPQYRLRAALGYGYEWENFEARGGFGYGGFNAYSFNLSLNWKLNRYLRLQGGLTNLFGVVSPAWSGGSIGNFAIRYYF